MQVRYHQSYSKTVLFLPAILIFLLYTSSVSFVDPVNSTQKALFFALIFAILVACMFLPDGLIIRPSKYIWKAITGISFFYLAILIYFIYLDKQTVIGIIHKYFDKGLETYNYEQISYGADCRLYAHDDKDPFKNIKSTFFDLFAFSHLAGWIAKTLVLRDLKFLIFCSITFQMIQYSLRNTLNNFKQCWWDHVLVDILGCNLVGIVIGVYIMDRFKLERYRWSLRDAPYHISLKEEMKQFLTNWDLSKLQTKALGSTMKFFQVFYMFFLFQVCDLNAFFLKYIYQIPPPNYMVISRVVVIGLLAVNATKQYYRFIIKRERELKINAFMINVVLFVEIFLIFKHGGGSFGHAYFDWLGYLFMGSLGLFFGFLLVKVLISDVINLVGRKKETKLQNHNNVEKLEVKKIK